MGVGPKSASALCAVAALSGLLLTAHAYADVGGTGTSVVSPDPREPVPKATSIALPFLGNAGQHPDEVAFVSSTRFGTSFVTRSGALVHALKPSAGSPCLTEARPPATDAHASGDRCEVSGTWSLIERFVDANRVEPLAAQRTPLNVSYFGAPTRVVGAYDRIEMGEVYPGVHASLVTAEGQIERIFVVAPAAAPGQIHIAFDGAIDLAAQRDGSLRIETGAGSLRLTPPVAYQYEHGTRQFVDVAYTVEGSSFRFVVGDYDTTLPLVIDPLLQATHLGAAASPQDYAFSLAVHPTNGDVYVAGSTYSSTFPGTSAGYQPSLAGSGTTDAFVARLSTDLTQLIGATFLGGAGQDGSGPSGSYGLLLAIEPVSGDVLIAGQTRSTNFPGVSGGAQPTTSGNDGFLARLSADLDVLINATYLGGVADALPSAIAIDHSTGDVVVVGSTSSASLPGVTGGAQPGYGGGQDVFAMRFDGLLTSRLQSTYFGGSGSENASSIAIDGTTGDVYVGGVTTSSTLPGTAGGAQLAGGGASDGFVTRLNAALTGVMRTTFVGGSALDSLGGVALDSATGDVIVAGSTRSMDLPGTGGGAQPAPSGDLGFQTDAYLVRFNGALTTRLAATYLGGSGDDDPKSIVIDPATGDIFVAGFTYSGNFPRVAGGIRASYSGAADAFVARIAGGLNVIRQATYLGGSNTDLALSLAIDPFDANLYLGGYTQSSNFPGTAGGAQPTGAPSGFPNAFVARLSPDLLANWPPASIAVVDGGGQSATVSTQFGAPLRARVLDAFGNPVAGANVTFALPNAVSSSGTFPGGVPAVMVVTDGSGIATSPPITANASAGGWNAVASVATAIPPVLFALSNLPGAPATVQASGGTPQSAPVNGAYAQPLTAVVRDASGNPVAGVLVTFQVASPPTQPSGSFAGGSTTALVATGANGSAQAPTLSANGIAGAFTVTASASGVALPATFSLTNVASVPGPPVIGTATPGNGQATVSFAAPTSDGGAPLLAFRATSSPGNVIGTCAAPCTSITVTGLTNGVSYTFAVEATNAAGTGPASQASNPVTPLAAASQTYLATSPNPSACTQGVTFTATVTGAAPTGVVTFDTGGMSPCAPVALTGGTAVCVASATTFGSFSVSATYSGDANNAPSAFQIVQDVSLGNVPPAAIAGGPYVANLGSNVVLRASDSSDANAACGDSIVSLSWDVNNDGVFDDAIGATPTLTAVQLAGLGLSAPGTYAIQLRATDSFGAAGFATGSLTLRSPTGDYIIDTIAGGGVGDGGLATNADLNQPFATAVDATGNVYIADRNNHRVRKVEFGTGLITTVVGTGENGFAGDGGPALSARLSLPIGVAVDGGGSLYIADHANMRIRRVDLATGIISTYAGNGSGGPSGDGGPATSASLGVPYGVAIDAAGNLYIGAGLYVRKVDVSTGLISTVAGSGSGAHGGDGGPATSAGLTAWGVAVDGSGNLYIADPANQRVRKVDLLMGNISTVAGVGGRGDYDGDGGPAVLASLNLPYAVAVDAGGNTFIADSQNGRIRRVDAATGLISTVAGSDGGGSVDGGPAVATRLVSPIGVTVDAGGNLLIADRVDERIRRVDAATGLISTLAGNGQGVGGFAGDGDIATKARLLTPFDAAVHDNHVYIADQGNHRVRKVSLTTGIISTVAGNGLGEFGGDGGPAVAASISSPAAVAVSGNGAVYIADTQNARIRRVDPATNGITTVAGNGMQGYAGDGGPGTSATLSTPTSIAIAPNGDVYFADGDNYRIRMVAAATGVITTFAGNGIRGFGGDGGPATSASFNGANLDIALDASSNLYVADSGNHRIRRVDAATGVITTVAGREFDGFGGDGGPASSAFLSRPTGVAVDPDGNIFLVDQGNRRVRKIGASTGVIATIAGGGPDGFSGDGGPATSAQFNYPQGIAVDGAGSVYVADTGNNRIRTLVPEGAQPPAAPTIGVATAVGTQASVTFSPPGNDGGSPITSYTATSTPGGHTGTCAAPCSTLTVAGLTMGVTYTFTVAATNAIGTGPASSPSNSVTPTPAPQFTSPASATFVVRSPSTFTVAAVGTPAPTLTRSGALPSGVTFTPATGVLAGTPANGTVGTYTITFTARNGIPPDGVQTFTLTVTKANQSITFNPLPDVAFGSPNFSIAATASSGLTVTFSSLTPSVCTVSSRTVRLVAAGTCTVAANQAGNGNYLPAPQLTRSFAVSTTATTVTTITTSREPSVVGQAYGVNVTVTAPTGVPKGSVTVDDGYGGTCTDLALSVAGVASCSITSTRAGTLTLTAAYSGSSGYSASTGSTSHAVNQAATRAVVTSSADPALPGTVVTLSARVTAISPGRGTPTGSVEFTSGGIVLATATLDSTGNAAFSTGSLAVGVHPIVANYLGDTNFGASASAIFNQDIVAFPVLQFSTSGVTVDESAGSVTLTVTHSGSALAPVTVQYASTDGTAVASGDYGAVGGTLTWNAGDGSNRTIVVPITIDTTSEPLERFTISLSSPTGATLGPRTTITVTIRAH